MVKPSFTLDKFLSERLGCTPSEYILIKKFITNSTMLSFKTLFIVHGADLDNAGPVSVLTPEQKEAYYRATHELKERLTKIRNTGLQTLQSILGMDDNDFALASAFLKRFDSEKVMASVFGKDYQDKGNIALLTPIQEKIYYSLIKQTQDYVNMQRKAITMQNVINCPDDIWPIIRDYILQNEEFSKLFVPIFGSDLATQAEVSLLSGPKKNDLANAIKNLRKTVSGYLKYVGKNLATIALLDEDEKDIVYNLLCDDKELTTLFGSDFSSELRESSYLEKGRENIRKLLDRALETKRRFRKYKRLQQVSSLSNDININGINTTEYDRALLKEALKMIPIRYRGILTLYLGLAGDEIFYPIERLAIIFNKDVPDIESDILHGKAYLEEIIETCQKAYERELEFSNTIDMSRIRVSESYGTLS